MDALIAASNILLLLSPLEDEELLRNFCGIVLTANDCSYNLPDLSRMTVYLCGDISKVNTDKLKTAARLLVVAELSYGHSNDGCSETWPRVGTGQIPILVHGVGVQFRRFFDADYDYYKRIHSEHTLQSLFESTKPTKAHRTGIYLTPVEQKGTELHFRLLRCSTNLSGPTENFRANDRHIVDALNEEATYIFRSQAPLNHVLAQNYLNIPAADGQKQAKAKISSHADKTKDMPANAIMAFCTFYDKLDKLRPLADDHFDYGYKGVSGLTKLRFRLKESVADFDRSHLPLQFAVTLYPNSVFFMPLSTNRLYTHEIQPAALDAELLPTRLGYVVRSSKTEAVHDGKDIFLGTGGKRVKLEPPTIQGMKELRELYAEENSSAARIDYGSRFLFSMNQGDYLAPGYRMEDEFRVYKLRAEDAHFADLDPSIQFEVVGKGRQGAVLVKTDQSGSIPIVRTTSKYAAPAQNFQIVHQKLVQQIRKCASLPLDLNNALVEKYTNAYTTMGSHSDQALDLVDESFIAVFSCYEHPELVQSPRMLVVESKETNGGFQIPLTHNSVVVFSTNTNKRFKHKIILPTTAGALENTWLGVTFRTSKTFIQIRDSKAYFLDGTPLEVANDEQSREFYRLRGRENRETDFTYPRITYTVSGSDTVVPECVTDSGTNE